MTNEGVGEGSLDDDDKGSDGDRREFRSIMAFLVTRLAYLALFFRSTSRMEPAKGLNQWRLLVNGEVVE